MTSRTPLTWCLVASLIGGLQSPSEGQTPDDSSAATIMKQWDGDGDGKLSLDELQRFLADRVPAESPAELEFIRVLRDAKEDPQSLETSIISFVDGENSLRIDLVGAVHVADKSYYRELNRRFRQYDAVLYELIAPEGTRIARGASATNHPVGKIQGGLKSLLNLSFQLEEIDYTHPKLVHADLSPDEFSSSMKERGESIWKLLFRMMGQAAAQAGNTDGPSDAEMLAAMLSPNRSLKLKRIFAEQFQDLEGQMSVFEGPDGSTLITERNKRALDVLANRIDAGDDHLAIFYGAGHMPDLARRLQERFNVRPAEQTWLRAWDMSDDK